MTPISELTTKTIVYGKGRKNAKIAIVGEAPGKTEESEREPFVGSSGRLLRSLAFRANILWDECYVTTVIKERPPNNRIESFIDLSKKTPVHKETYDDYVAYLKEELKEISPNVVLAVGNVALYALTGETGITAWRGSILESTLIPGLKVIPCIHPSVALKQYLYQYYIFHDLQRVVEQADFPDIRKPQLTYFTNPTFEQLMAYLEACEESKLLGFDIEVSGYKYGLSEVSCISFSKDQESAMSITFMKGGKPRWSPFYEKQIWDKIASLLSNPNIRKVAQNRFFDTQFLFHRYGFIVTNCEDTMIAQALLYPDFPKGLDFICSMFTDIGYYKADGKEFMGGLGNEESFWLYNAKDSMVLTIAFPQMEESLEEKGLLETYRYQNELVEALIFMSERGMKIDVPGLTRKSEETKIELDNIEKEFYRLAGREINLRSHQQLKEYFYGKKRDGNLGLTPYKSRTTGKPSTDENALLQLSRPLKSRPAVEEARLLLEHRKLSKLKSTYFEMAYDEDGRIRSSMNPVGTRTGRLSSSKNIFGTGANLQNQPYALKEFFLVDDNYIAYEIDLSQAENRIVAYVAPEPKLIDAFENKIDIHSRTASYIFKKHESLISSEDGSAPQFGNGEHSERFWGKKANHAFNYGQSANAFSQQMLISIGEAQTIYHAYHNAYPGIFKYHNMIRQQLEINRTLTNLFGRRYIFLDRWDFSLFLAAYAFIPQSTIADIINRWGIIPIYKEERHVVLLNQIHDSIVFEISKDVPIEEHAEILLRIRDRLTQPLEWHGRKFTIPCDLKILTTNLMKGTETKMENLCQEELTNLIKEAVAKNK